MLYVFCSSDRHSGSVASRRLCVRPLERPPRGDILPLPGGHCRQLCGAWEREGERKYI